MLKANFHCHSTYSDGKNTIEEIIQQAISQDLKAIGISDHSPLKIECKCNMKQENLQAYISEIEDLRTKYNKIKIYKGMEIDWLEDKQNLNYINLEKLDYSIGSIHFTKVDNEKYIPIDLSKKKQIELVEKYFNSNFQNLVLKYLQDIKTMIENNSPTFIGHIDLYKKFNKGEALFKEDTPEILESIEEILEIAKKKDIGLEINTGGISRGFIDTPYPSLKILKMCYQRGIKIIASSDAHKKEDIIANFDIAEDIIKKAGYKNQLSLEDNTIPFFYK